MIGIVIPQPGDIFWEYEIVDVRELSVTYRYVGASKQWRMRTSDFQEWLAMQVPRFPRCQKRGNIITR